MRGETMDKKFVKLIKDKNKKENEKKKEMYEAQTDKNYKDGDKN